MKYLMRLAYLGTGFFGSQIQPQVRTVQGVLNDAFAALFGVRCLVTACSRTDRGVHAVAAALTVALPDGTTPIPPDRLPFAVKCYLPQDVSVFSAVVVPDTFHVRHDVVKKEYRYRLCNTPLPDPFRVGRVWFYPHPLTEQALCRMRTAAGYLVGTHDFRSFMAEGSPVATTVRTVYDLAVDRAGDELIFTISADGFLYNMVRILVGTLVEVGAGRRDPESIPAVLSATDRTAAGMTAPPDGLYLNRVFYAP